MFAREELPTNTIRSRRMPTSARRAGAPVPSTTVPPRISTSTESASTGNDAATVGIGVGTPVGIDVGIDVPSSTGISAKLRRLGIAVIAVRVWDDVNRPAATCSHRDVARLWRYIADESSPAPVITFCNSICNRSADHAGIFARQGIADMRQRHHSAPGAVQRGTAIRTGITFATRPRFALCLPLMNESKVCCC
jgi:hypothetical protein